MMRNKASSSMQKTYDECYLVCSTAVYFEGQVCCISFVAHSIYPLADYNMLDRITKQRLYAHGVLHSTRSITTMPTESRQITSQSQRPRGRYKSHFGTWSCNARSAWIFWKHCERVGRRYKLTETRLAAAAARRLAAGRRCLPTLIMRWDTGQVQNGLVRVLCLR